MRKKYLILLTILSVGLLTISCSGNSSNGDTNLTVSGTISAMSVNIAPEVGGKVTEVFADESDSVTAGDPLFAIDREFIQAQLDQAKAAETTAAAALATTELQYEMAGLQLELAVQNSRFQFADVLANEQRLTQPNAFELPVWYFSRDEEIAIAESIVEKSEAELKEKVSELETVLTDIVNSDFIVLEKELAEAQNEYFVADATLDTVSRASDNTELKDAAQDIFDLTETKLEDVQERYDQELDTDVAEDVLEARAAVGVAQATYDEAVNYLQSLYIGDDSLQVQAAAAGADLAKSNVVQAEAGLAQAQAAARSIEIQFEKANVTSPISGEILTQNVEVGELVGAGGVVMTVGNIDTVSLTVYIPEDEYGRVSLGQDVKVTVDSFPEMTYMGKVTYISNSAEFTPSNVQTVEGRKSTVFAIEIAIENDNHDLKPGMPADVEFIF